MKRNPQETQDKTDKSPMSRLLSARSMWSRMAFLLFAFFSSLSRAGSGITYHGKIIKPDGVTPVTSVTTQFRIQIRTPGSENCLLWEEQQTKDLSSSSGVFTITINDTAEPSLIANALPYSLERVFSNRTNYTALTNCAVGSTYSPSSAVDGRNLQVYFKENPADPWEQMPLTKVNFIPLSLNSVQLEGYQASEFLKIDPLSSYTTLTAANVNTLVDIIAGTNAQYLKPSSTFAGDVTGTSSTTVVEKIRGTNVVATAPTVNQVLKFDGTNWSPAADDTGGSPADSSYSVKGTVQINTDLATSGLFIAAGVLALPNVITAGGPTGDAQTVPVITYDQKGRLTAVSTATIDDTTKLPLAGGTMTGHINMGTQNITNATSIAATNFSGRNLILSDNDTNTVTVKTPTDITADYVLTLPADDGNSGQILSTDGSGALSWVAANSGLSLTANQAVIANGTGTSLSSFTCSIGQVMSFDAAGLPVCGNVTGAGGFVQNGNSYGAAATLGTNDNFDLNFETNGTTKMTVLANGNVGIGTTVPTAKLHLPAGTASASTAPLKFEPTAATKMTTPENGAMEFDGTDYYLTAGGTRNKISTSSGGSGDFVLKAGDSMSGALILSPNSAITSGTSRTVGVSTTANPVATSTASNYGGHFQIGWNGSANSAGATVVGVSGNSKINLATTAALGTQIGVEANAGISISTNNAFVLDNSYGVKASINNDPTFGTTPTITNAHGLHSSITRSGGGVTTNGYGLYVGNIQATNRWSIYASDSTAPSYFAGNVGIGTTTPATALDLNGAWSVRGMAAPAVSVATQGRIYFDSTANKFKVSENNGAYVDLVGGGSGISGLTTGYLPKATSATAIGDSIISESSGKIGIGTAAPGKMLQVDGTVQLRGSGSSTGLNVLSTGQVVVGGSTASASNHGIDVYPVNGGTQASINVVKTGAGDQAAFGMVTNGANSASNVNWWMGLQGNSNDFAFGYWDGTTIKTTFTILNNGKMGIGTTAPKGPFHVVNGTAGAFTPVTDETIVLQRNTSTSSNAVMTIVAGATGESIIRLTNSGATEAGKVGYDNNANKMYFFTNGTEKVRIDSSGNFGIGVTNPGSKLQVAGDITPSADTLYALGGPALRFSDVYSMNAANNTSDVREKKQIENSDLGLNLLTKLRPVSYLWKSGQDQNVHYGLIAQETEQAIAESQNKTADNQHPVIVTYDQGTDRYGIRYTELISPIIKAVQELYEKLLDHDEKILAQEREIASLKNQMSAETKRLEEENKKLKSYLCKKDPSAEICQ
jgi:hypothetical protein